MRLAAFQNLSSLSLSLSLSKAESSVADIVEVLGSSLCFLLEYAFFLSLCLSLYVCLCEWRKSNRTTLFFENWAVELRRSRRAGQRCLGARISYVAMISVRRGRGLRRDDAVILSLSFSFLSLSVSCLACQKL